MNIHHHSSNMSLAPAFPTMVSPLITPINNNLLHLNSHSSHSSQQQSSSSGGGQQHSTGSSSSTSSSQASNLEHQNQMLARKLQTKMTETDKLQRKVDRTENELADYKRLLTQINLSMAQGNSANSDSIKFAIQNAVSVMKLPKNGKGSKGHSARPTKRHAASSCAGCFCNSVSERPFVCDWPECGKRFRQKHHLDSHRNIHTGSRFTCDWPDCGKTFVRKYNMQEHTKQHNEPTHNMCLFPNCNMAFSSKYSLMRHQQSQHDLALGPP